jgi:hypothetical protein
LWVEVTFLSDICIIYEPKNKDMSKTKQLQELINRTLLIKRAVNDQVKNLTRISESLNDVLSELETLATSSPNKTQKIFQDNFNGNKPKKGKVLKIWNGRSPKPQYKGNVYIAAYSRAAAHRLLEKAFKVYIGPNEIKNYFSENAWGNYMNGITPTEPCVYVQETNTSTPIRLL